MCTSVYPKLRFWIISLNSKQNAKKINNRCSETVNRFSFNIVNEKKDRIESLNPICAKKKAIEFIHFQRPTIERIKPRMTEMQVLEQLVIVCIIVKL